MDSKELLKFCFERGFLLDKDILNLFKGIGNEEVMKLLLERLGSQTQKKILTKTFFEQNKERVCQILLSLPEENQQVIEGLKIKLGLNISISKEISFTKEVPSLDSAGLGKNSNPIENSVVETVELNKNVENNKITSPPNLEQEDVKILSVNPSFSKQLEVQDFTRHFRGRFLELRNFLQERGELNNLVSINKISGGRQGFSLIGIVLDKRVTINKNVILEIEDLTGSIKAFVKKENKELFAKAEEIALDSVIGLKCSGDREFVFVNDIIFPDSILAERKKSPNEEYALFTGDIHAGSSKFLESNFLKFTDYLKGKIPFTPEVEKIKYLFIAGDLIAGVGIYQDQEKELTLSDVEGQYQKVAELLEKIPKRIKIILSPGNHDAMRIMEPQPLLDEKYAWPIYDLKNVILTGNPSLVNVGSKKNFSGFDVLTYHGYSYHFYANNISKLIMEKATHAPEKIMAYLLKNKHLAPTHASNLYFPSEEDYFVINKTPDIFLSAHTHKSAVSYYNNILTISSSCWESKTAFQEKMGNEPDFCKVPLFNMKTRAIKILDFEDRKEDENE